MPLADYIAAYCEDFNFAADELITQEISGVKVTVQPYSFDGGQSVGCREKAHITLSRGSAVYECDCIDEHHWERMFFPVTLGGQDYLLFRKTLCGFTLIHADTLEEAYDYFPEKVTHDEEAYIITGAVSFDDLIVFDGCFWACPYMHAVYDHSARRFLLLYREFVLEADDGAWKIEGSTITLPCRTADGEKTELTITSGELRKLIREKGHSEL